jgi:hypothetical protein
LARDGDLGLGGNARNVYGVQVVPVQGFSRSVFESGRTSGLMLVVVVVVVLVLVLVVVYYGGYE